MQIEYVVLLCFALEIERHIHSAHDIVYYIHLRIKISFTTAICEILMIHGHIACMCCAHELAQTNKKTKQTHSTTFDDGKLNGFAGI